MVIQMEFQWVISMVSWLGYLNPIELDSTTDLQTETRTEVLTVGRTDRTMVIQTEYP